MDERIEGVADGHAPTGGAVGARDFLGCLEQIHARAAQPAIRLRQTDRTEIGSIKAAATLSVSRPSRSEASASSLIKPLIALARDSGVSEGR